MPKQKSIYRKVSLDRLSSPEQLDQKLTVVSPAGWVAAVSFAVLIAAALAWGFFGSVPNRVSGNGVLMPGEGVVSLVSRTSGQITEMRVSSGETVEEGQVIALVSQDDLIRQIERVQDNLAALGGINPYTLEMDIDLMRGDLFREFSQLSMQIHSTRAQLEAQRGEARHNEQDFENRHELQAQQVSALEGQISTLETQIASYEQLFEYQRQVDLENARTQDAQRIAAAGGPSAVSQVLSRPLTDPTLSQMTAQLDDLNWQISTIRSQIAEIEQIDPNAPELDGLRQDEDRLSRQITELERQISDHQALLAYQREIDLANARIQDEQRAAQMAAPSAVDQVLRRPNVDPNLTSMRSQLENYRLQLIQARIQEAQLGDMPTDFVWGGYNQTGEQLISLIEQFAVLMQVTRLDMERELRELETRLAENSEIKAHYSGTLTSLTVSQYDFVQPGSILGNIVRCTAEETDDHAHIVILYVPVDRGMLVREGMTVNVSPATVNREEHGYILGVVRAVSAFAVTQEHMIATLQNQQLVQMFSEQGPVIEVEVELMRDAATVSGYQWSTPRGAPFAIEQGTVSSGQITIYTQRPIDRVVPFLRQLIYGG